MIFNRTLSDLYYHDFKNAMLTQTILKSLVTSDMHKIKKTNLLDKLLVAYTSFIKQENYRKKVGRC